MKSIDDIGRLFDELLQFQFVKIESAIHDFKAWMKEEDLAEENEDVTAYDEETFSIATNFMQISVENEESSGRRLDLMTKTKYNQVNIGLTR
ncbi:hypothetical protein EDC94DRAFT_663363 [Helicostylum pulchrum]|nr:hypothetical protein EDC94DRAFT_663363 [Helicostylum pulchrum]